MTQMSPLSRRRLLRGLAATGASALYPQLASSRQAPVLSKPIPSTGEQLPAVGLGSWITFNVGNDPIARDACAQVMGAFFDSGGRLIDSSPMYGSSQKVIGHGLTKLNGPPGLFSADKVWISSGARGPDQIEASRRFWGVPRFDLLQVHNLLSWEEHLRTLFAMKAAGRLRYVGITTSEGRRHGEVERIMRAQPLDFVQVTYNILDREVEDRILPLARDRGIGVIVNRPFREGELLRKIGRHPLPGVGRRDRLHKLGTDRSQVHRHSSGRDLRHPGDHPCRSCAGKHGCRYRAAAGQGDARPHGRPCREALMSEWWTYSLSDFLLFSARTYYRLFELYNLVVWPWHVLAIALGLAVLVSWLRRGAWQGRSVAVILAICWLFVAWAYLLAHYDTINWAAQLFRRGLCDRGAVAGLGWPYPQLAVAAPGPGRGRRDRALHLRLCTVRLAAGRPAARSAVAPGRDLRHCARSHRGGDAGGSRCC